MNLNFEFHDLFPWERKNVFLAGGYLLEMMMNNKENNQENKKELLDIDIFLFGSISEKKNHYYFFLKIY